jgi:hypothetical protein
MERSYCSANFYMLNIGSSVVAQGGADPLIPPLSADHVMSEMFVLRTPTSLSGTFKASVFFFQCPQKVWSVWSLFHWSIVNLNVQLELGPHKKLSAAVFVRCELLVLYLPSTRTPYCFKRD